MRWITFALKQRLVMWAMGQFLPKSIDFKPYLREALLGITAAAFGGALLAIAVGTILAALHFFMVANGFSTSASLGVVGVIALVMAFSAFYFARKCMVISTNFKGKFTGLSPKQTVKNAGIAIADGFLNGWNSAKDAEKRKAAKNTVLTLQPPASRRTHY